MNITTQTLFRGFLGIFGLCYCYWWVFVRKTNTITKDDLDFFTKLLLGNHSSLSDDVVSQMKKDFQLWLIVQDKLHEKVSPKNYLRYKKCQASNKYHIFAPMFSSEKPDNHWENFMTGIFTEPFPSSHDMDDWAVHTKTADIFLLKGITPRDSCKFYIHITHRFVDHGVNEKGIIRFDIYKKKDIK